MKVVCIKECNYSINRLVDYHFNVGDQFELSYLQYSPGGLYSHKLSIVIDFNGEPYDISVLKSDFITLEQWRDNQINQILS
jgi:hypothetical protein